MRLLYAAADARLTPRKLRPLLRAPASFQGTLAEFAEHYIVPNIPEPALVVEFHHALTEYVRKGEARLLLRKVSKTIRREDYVTRDGTCFRATDNAPAWWVHAALFQGYRVAPGAMADVVATMPCHMFDIARTAAPVAATYGWHIAHIFNVNDGNTDYAQWGRNEAIARFVRNVHPANYFLLPKIDWQRWGGDERVIGYFGELYKKRYAAIWGDFMALSRGVASALTRTPSDILYAYGNEAQGSALTIVPIVSEAAEATTDKPTSPMLEYRASRLTFKRDIIERLHDAEAFRVITPFGTFQMTKADVYEVFPGVVASRSYREAGTYNYPSLPRKAERFRTS